MKGKVSQATSQLWLRSCQNSLWRLPWKVYEKKNSRLFIPITREQILSIRKCSSLLYTDTNPEDMLYCYKDFEVPTHVHLIVMSWLPAHNNWHWSWSMKIELSIHLHFNYYVLLEIKHVCITKQKIELT